MPPNRFESEVESFLEGSHGDRTHIKRADHHTVTPLCGTLLYGAACWESFVPAPASRAVQSSPCVACYWREREKILPACGKWAEIGVFVCAGRVLYRVIPLGCVLGEFCTGGGFVAWR